MPFLLEYKDMSKLEQEIKENVRWIESVGGEEPDILVDDLPSPELTIQGKKIISFCSNNYFGLNKHPDVLNAAVTALERYGIGTCESRRLGGNLQLLEDLEKKIAGFKSKENAVIFPTGLLTNMAVIPTLTDTGFYRKLFWKSIELNQEIPVILGDELNHRSIQLGIKLSHAEFYKYKHSDMDDLERLLKEFRERKVLIITDAVFSMDGDLAPLNRIVELAGNYHAMIMIDDAHGTGIYGATGRGTAEHFGVSEGIDVHMGTFSKAFGGLGGFVAVNDEIAKAIKYTSSGYYFTSSLPPEQAAGMITSIDILEKTPILRARLWHNVEEITIGLAKIGFDIPKRWSHIIPIFIRDDEKARELEKFLLARGILCSSVHAPAIRPGTARLRITVNAIHTQQHIDLLLRCLYEAVKTMDIPTQPMSRDEIFQEFGVFASILSKS